MFQQGNYDEITIRAPTQGMNKFLSPDILPDGFAYHLENILPFPTGSGVVRCGTKEIRILIEQEISVMEAFYFITPENIEQEVIYAQSYKIDETTANFNVIDQRRISFETERMGRYIEETYLRITYTIDESPYTFYPKIQSIILGVDSIDITLSEAFFPQREDIVVTEISYSVGRIYAYTISSDTLSDILKDDLDVACIPRHAIFNKTLLICNGVNNLLYYNGNEVAEIYDFVKETKANNFSRNSNVDFSFATLNGFLADKYYAGNKIQLKVNGEITELTIDEFEEGDETADITVEEELPAFGENDEVELFYKDYPPPFNYLYAGSSRLWALGPGRAGLDWREPNETLRLYFTYEPDTIFDWFNENTKTVPSIDMSNTHGILDNFEAICNINGLFAIIGRSRTQVWSGTIPPFSAGAQSDMNWQSTLDVGIANGNLLINMPNDAYFISQTGLKSFGTLNVAKQFAATSVNAIDPIIEEFMSKIMKSDYSYRACRSFKYQLGKLCGFKIGENKILVSPFETHPYAWTFFSGDFQKSSTFLDTGKFLSIFINNGIYKYADGLDGSAILYGDNNGKSLISFSWSPGLQNRGTRGFSNKRYQLILSYPSSFPLNDKNSINITVYGNTPSTFRKSESCQFDKKGDLLGEAPLKLEEDYNSRSNTFRLGIDYSFLIKRFKFSVSKFWVLLNGYAIDGPIYFREIKFFGVRERNG
jgi:hypothetical protein